MADENRESPPVVTGGGRMRILPAGKPEPSLKERLCTEGYRYSFLQAFRLLRFLLLKDSPATESEIRNRIRVRPELSLEFPERDVASISEEDGRYAVTTTFLGLYGTSSPLPSFYTEDLLADRSDDKTAAREFLDIINSRLYTLFFQCWARYNLLYKIQEERDPALATRLFCMLGLEDERERKRIPDAAGLLRYAGIFTAMAKSAEGLRSILSDALGEPSLEIEQCLERKVKIPRDQRFILGESGNVLGEESYLGEEVPDRMGAFRIRIGPIDPERFDLYLPDGAMFGKIRQLISFYLDQPFDWDLEVLVREPATAGYRLGEERPCRLGWNTWLFAENSQTPVTSTALFNGKL